MGAEVEIQSACAAAASATAAFSGMPPADRAAILDAIAAALEARRGEILDVCAAETALTIEELTPEFARMTGTLRMFAAVVREGSWVRAAIDTPGPSPIGPNHDIRRLLVPLGPVAVFGSSNFPLAYGVCGGDTASALAAGCPVIVKEHPAHPKTGRLISDIARHAIRSAGCRAELLGYLPHEDPSDFSIAEQLVQHRAIAAVGFTGSTAGGMALHQLAEKRRYPIPVFAEMGSLNTVFVSATAFARRAQVIADEIAASVLARVGQQCTKPGVVFIAGNNEHWGLHRMISERLLAATPRRMLARNVADHYYRRLDTVSKSMGILETTALPTPAQRDAMLGVPVVIAASDIAMEDSPEVWDEIFGPAIIIARYNNSAEFQLDGRLGLSVYGELEDFAYDPEREDSFSPCEWGRFSEWSARVASHAGRIIFNGVPTGVRVGFGMVHGGPYPATNRPDSTAVGPYAMHRWCRPVCFQNCPDALLPPELQNANPRGIWRVLNGVQTKSPVA